MLEHCVLRLLLRVRFDVRSKTDSEDGIKSTRALNNCYNNVHTGRAVLSHESFGWICVYGSHISALCKCMRSLIAPRCAAFMSSIFSIHGHEADSGDIQNATYFQLSRRVTGLTFVC